LLVALVGGPWLTPGYVFGTDWPGPKTIPIPSELSSSAALQLALSIASSAVGGALTGKVFILGSLFVAGLFAYRSQSQLGFVPAAVASTIYVINPFVYGRLHYGQLYLVAGYAVLPWVATRLRQLFAEPTLARGLLAAASIILVGILSLHLFFVSALFFAVLAAWHLFLATDRLTYARKLLAASFVGWTATLGASIYWIIPLFTSHGPEGSRLAGISNGDLTAFAAIPDQAAGLIPNLLGLYGFWAEATNRFNSMKTFVPFWLGILACLLALSAIGSAFALVRGKWPTRPWVAGVVSMAIIALILEMGISDPATASFVRWLDATVPPYRGMRDAGKWAAVLALAYSQLGGLGAAVVLDWLRIHVSNLARREWAISVATALLLAVPLYYGNGLLYGSHGEIQPSPYPAGWYAADHVLAADPHPGKTLFLPWHQYMTYSFVRNQNKVVASPAPTFFSVPIVASTNPEVPAIPPPTDPEQVAISTLVHDGPAGQWSATLAIHGFKYVLLAHELDWATYEYLDKQPGISLVADYGSIQLYRTSA